MIYLNDFSHALRFSDGNYSNMYLLNVCFFASKCINQNNGIQFNSIQF